MRVLAAALLLSACTRGSTDGPARGASPQADPLESAGARAAVAPVRGPDPPPPPRHAGTFGFWYVLCDCDPGVTVLQASRPVAVYTEPDASSRVVRTLPPGAFVEPAHVRNELTVVVRAGEAVLRDTLTLPAWRYGAVPAITDETDPGDAVPLSLAAGDRIEFLADDSDTGFFRVGGVVYATPMQNLEGDRLAWRRRAPELETWLHLDTTPTEPATWVRMDGGPDGSGLVPFCDAPNGLRSGCSPAK